MRPITAPPSPLDTQRSLDVVRGKLEKLQKAPAEDVRPAQEPPAEALVSAIPVARTNPAISQTEQALQSQLIDSQRVSQLAPAANSSELRSSVATDPPVIAANRGNTPAEPSAAQTAPRGLTAETPQAVATRPQTNAPQASTIVVQAATPDNRASAPAAEESSRSEALPATPLPEADKSEQTQNLETSSSRALTQDTNSTTENDSSDNPPANNSNQQIFSNRQPPAVEREYQEALRATDSGPQISEVQRETPTTRSQAPANQPRVNTEADTQSQIASSPRTEQAPATVSINNTRSTAEVTRPTEDSERQQNRDRSTRTEQTVPVETRAPINASQQAITQYQASQSLLQDATSTIRVRTTA